MLLNSEYVNYREFSDRESIQNKFFSETKRTERSFSIIINNPSILLFFTIQEMFDYFT